MTNRILGLLAAAALFSSGLFSTSVAFSSQPQSGSELEKAARVKELPGTVIVRMSETTGEVSVLELSERLSASPETVRLVAKLEGFKAISEMSNTVGELDRTSSSSSWYAWYNYGYGYAPTYYYAGYAYAYSNYYFYNWYGYAYYWYRW